MSAAGSRRPKAARKPAKTGRPSKLDADRTRKILDAVRAGAYVETAAAFAGIHKDTFYEWLRRGAEEESGPFHDFSDALARAMAESEMVDVTRLAQHAETDWRASAWRLERRFPQRWCRRESIEHSGPQGGPMQAEVNRAIVEDEASREAAAELRRRVAAARRVESGRPRARD